jgi:hypothetical protein
MVAGCTAQPPPTEAPPPPVPAAECRLLDAAAAGPAELQIALLDDISPAAAPIPRNESERLLFRQAYETLVRVDCAGRIRPSLAESWTLEDGGRSWRFVLRQGARFWDGTAVSSEDVSRSWERQPGWAGYDSVTYEGDRAFTVHFDQPFVELPPLFAEPERAIARRSQESTWPQGTGPYRIEGPVPSGDFSHLLVDARSLDDAAPDIAFRLATSTDARDLIDGGIDVMVTGDPDVLDYVRRRTELAVTPLPWDRTYVLLSPTRARELRARQVATPSLPTIPDDLRSALASDAVRGDARAHGTVAWWEDVPACEAALADLRSVPPAVSTAAYRIRGPRRVVYAEGDDVARGLAERIVALATRPASVEQSTILADAVPGLGEADAPLLVTSLERDRFEEALRLGDEFLFVLALRYRALDPCGQLTRLASRVPWLNIGWVAAEAAILPLVDVRHHLVARQGAASLALDWDGTVRVVGPEAGGRVP